MAKVTITIEDGDDFEDGSPSVDVNAEFDPPANNGVTEDTQAQGIAKTVMIVLSEALGGQDFRAEYGKPGN